MSVWERMLSFIVSSTSRRWRHATQIPDLVTWWERCSSRALPGPIAGRRNDQMSQQVKQLAVGADLASPIVENWV